MPDNQAPHTTQDALKHDYRRGEIIWVLKQDYPHLVTFRMLQLALRDNNVPIGWKDLYSYLSYLEETGYVRCEHFFNESEAADWISGAALTAKGMQLFNRKISDPGVRF